ncbi:hypothetical protein ASPCAL10019 [Aspergillus calidoustus]|uniref:Uncharacterized protein n=1 Tax=Aspergillus calidoustus TaxID=454130 RepID=A0A0U5GAY9_ASPCI|nr:hypothetical protein ASPCAL10019 [Aspergillus calidoustus]
MLAILFALLLVPLAVTSPHVTSFASLVVDRARDFYYAYPFYYYISLISFAESLPYYFTSIFNGWASWASQFWCSQKCRQRIRRLLEKKGVVGALITLLPSDSQIYAEWLLADNMTVYFIYLFVFRYIRVLGNLISLLFLNGSTPVPKKNKVRRSDCTVIIPVVNPESQQFEECLISCLINEPACVLVVTSSAKMATLTKRLMIPFMQRFPYTKIAVKTGNGVNKRLQIATGLGYVNTKITVLLDEHAIWPSARFLPALLAPFANPRVGIVGTTKRARRGPEGFNWPSFLNMLGAIEVDRESRDIESTCAIDGGVSAVSSLTSAHRSEIISNPAFLTAYSWEYLGWGMFGPFAVDESAADNFLTRWTVKEGYAVRIQSSHDACVEIALDNAGVTGFLAESLRKARTAFRSSCASLTSPISWFRHPWCTYAVYATSILDIPLVYDAALVYTLWDSRLGEQQHAFFYLSRVMLGAKLLEVIPYFLREPQDMFLAPGYLLWSYVHSVLKVFAMVTFWNTGPGERANGPAHVLPPPPAPAPAPAPVPAARRPGYHIDTVAQNPSPASPRSPANAARRPFEVPVAAVAAPVKRPRGRPKKVPDLGIIPSIEEPIMVASPKVAKKRGRPRKKL